MRPFITVLAAICVLSLPVIAQAGDGCPYSKQEVTTASTEAEAAGACAASCAHTKTTAAATGCVCSGEATASLQTDQADAPDSTQDVAAND